MLYVVPALTRDGDGVSPSVHGHSPFSGGELSHIVLENNI